MKLYLDNFSVELDLDSESIFGIYLEGKEVYFLHSDSTITVFVNGKIDCYRFGNSIDFFKYFRLKKVLKNVLSQKNEKKLEPKKFSAWSRSKKNKLG